MVRTYRIERESCSLGAANLSPVTQTNPSEVKKWNLFALRDQRTKHNAGSLTGPIGELISSSCSRSQSVIKAGATFSEHVSEAGNNS